MFDESAQYYDILYSWKDYTSESSRIIDLIQLHKPDCRLVLDIGCGTAEHHKYLKSVFQIEGLDINPVFLDIAKNKNPECLYHQGDMETFNLKRQYDVILCLFSSIGYLVNINSVISALLTFKKHLSPGGIMIIEPWITPEQWIPGKLHMLTYEQDNIKICRMNKSDSKDGKSIIHFHYLLGTESDGVSYFEEIHELTLFSVHELMTAFTNANLKVKYDEEGLTGRGLYIAYSF